MLDGSPEAPPAGEAAWNPWGEVDAGTIGCGAEQCSSGSEVCTRDGCVALTRLTEDESLGFRWWAACDERSDCGAARHCCEQFGNSSVSPARRICQSASCEGDVACAGAVDCGAGMKCKRETVRGSDAKVGWCTERQRRIPCGSMVCTSPAHCEWRAGRRARCTHKPTESDDEIWSLACTGPADCAAGRSCCLSQVGRGSWCANLCDSGRSHVALCKKDEDCPTVGDHAGRCVASDGPEFVRWCR